MKLVILFVILIIILPIAIQILRGSGSHMFRFGDSSNKFQKRMETSFTGITSICVDVLVDSVDVVEAKEGEEIVVAYYSAFEDENKMTTKTQGETLLIEREKKELFSFTPHSGKLVVSVPKNLLLSYQIITVSGSILLDTKSSNVEVESTSGSIEVQKEGDSIRMESISGSIKCMAPFGTISANTTSGSVKLVGETEKTKRVRASSVSGSVKVYLPKECGYQMSYASVSGSVKDINRGLRFEKNGETKQGNEEVVMDLRTTSGSIKILEE